MFSQHNLEICPKTDKFTNGDRNKDAKTLSSQKFFKITIAEMETTSAGKKMKRKSVNI